MINETNIVQSFPSFVIPNHDGLPIEVSLIAQLGHGAGNQLFQKVAARQTYHNDFVDELDEPSAKLAGTNFNLGDTTSLYSFIVGPKGHPFHRHAGHRIFTAVSGSGGAQLRFSTASQAQMDADPDSFIRNLHFINIPADCLFTVRFGGDTWHQFWPLSTNSLHPVFFALSCHTDELGGIESEALKDEIKANKASIPSLTELLPPEVDQLIKTKDFQSVVVPTTTLSVDAAAGTFHRAVCDTVRSNMGMVRGFWGAWLGSSGYISKSSLTQNVTELDEVPADSLLQKQFADEKVDHRDTFRLNIHGVDVKDITATELLAHMLEGFLLNPPKGVSRLMLIRNILVSPIGLRTSPLGCPVSSLLSQSTQNLFANQYPVLDQLINAEDTHAQVVLGANDKHLRFRSCVSVQKLDDHNFEITLGTAVHCINAFGQFYIHSIDLVHRKYITPTMMKRAADYLITQIKQV